jgi:hypothetical protein
MGDDHDLRDTMDDGLQSLMQEVHTICASSLKDWEIYPNKGANLSDFVGEANNRSTGDAIHDRLRLALVASGTVIEEDLQIKVIPVHIYRVLVIIKIDAVSTPLNKLTPGQGIMTRLVFDFMEQNMFFLDKTPVLIGG